MKVLFFTMLLLFTSSQSFAKCSLAFGFIGGEGKAHMIEKLGKSLTSTLSQYDEKNFAYYAETPFEAARSDYYLLITRANTGFEVTVNDTLLVEQLYNNTYSNYAFRSENEVIKVIVEDLENDLFAKLKYCK